MDSLPPIPTPAGQRWREFRIRVMPGIVFVLGVIAIFFLWRNMQVPGNMVGQVEAITANLTTTRAGQIIEMGVDRFDIVTKGQALCTLNTFDPDVTRATLAAIEADLRVMQGRLSLNTVQTLDSATALRLNLLTQQTLLSIAIVKLQEAETVFNRSDKLFRDKIISEAQFDIVRAQRDTLKAEVADRTKLVAEWEKDVAALTPLYKESIEKLDPLLLDNIAKKQEEIRQLQKPTVLKAPFDGRVSMIFHRPGEKVAAGDPIFAITPLKSDRIIGFLRQPLSINPKVGDTVEVATRTQKRLVAKARITDIGSQLEPIDPLLLPAGKAMPETGLPVAISMPPGLNLVPGEIVNLTYLPKEMGSAAPSSKPAAFPK